MAAPNSNVDLFDAYFRRADLNGDGRIDGNEAIAFFQGSNLPNQVLAKIWAFADKNRAGFLGRAEFYNALKLVTVAQSKRELSPDIVNSALYGPASSKIPAPQIKIPGAPAPSQLNAGGAPTSASQMGVAVARSPQNSAFRGPAVSVSNSSATQPYSLSVNQSARPLQAMSGVTTRPIHGVVSQGFSGGGLTMGSNFPSYLNAPGMGTAGGGPVGMIMQVSDRSGSPVQAGITSQLPGSVASLPPRSSPSTGIVTSTSSSVDLKSPVSQNGYATNTLSGRHAFAPVLPQPKGESPDPSPSTGGILNASDDGLITNLSSSAGGVANSSTPIPSSADSQSLLKPLDSLHSSFNMQPGGEGLQQQSIPKPNQQAASLSVSSASGVSPQIAASSQSQPQWPSMTQLDIQKYTKVFVAVDTDKDGKITGEQARNLFLSWRLPREVLKQVWDLSDQDNDTMLSLREFCIALYLMERYREGRPLPSVLPSNIMYGLPASRQPTSGHGNIAWAYSSSPGVLQQQSSSSSGARQTACPSGRPPLPIPSTNNEERILPKQQKAKIPELEKHLVDQLSEEEQKSLNSKFQEATEANKKVEELEKDIKEAREKMEFYRVKMQELVLYKSRCDNRLNEITERASADKREVETLSKTYEEKYRQAGDVASKLTIEEATFRDVHEKKMELYRAIVKLEEEGDKDDSLKNRIESIRSDLEDLVKSLNERCKKYGLRSKPTTLLELPFGWQPRVQEGAADWDEDWDKFEDDGFTYVKELTTEVKNVVAPPKIKVKLASKKSSSVDDSKQTAASAEAEGITVMQGSIGEQAAESDAMTEKSADVVRLDENGSAHDRTEHNFAKSPTGSPASKSSHVTPLDEYGDNHVDKSSNVDASPHEKDTKRNHVEKSFNGASSGTFDTNNMGSVWGFNQEANHGKHTDDDLFGPGGLALNPIRTSSSSPDGNFMKKSTIFADSVPGTPLVDASHSPQKHGEGFGEHGFNFSRFDSFRSTESRELSRFDSMRSTAGSDDGGSGFPSFDDSDPFRTGPFKSTFGTETPRSEFSGPFRSTFGSETPRSESVGPFKSTFGSETPRSEFGELFRPTFGSETPRSEYGGPFRSTFGSETPRSEFGGPFTSAFGSETPRSEFGVPFTSVFGSETPRSEFGGPFRSTFGTETPRSEYDAFGLVGPFKSSFGSETPRRDLDTFGYAGSFKSSFGSETPRTNEDPLGAAGSFRSTIRKETPGRDSDPFGSTGPFKSSFTKETPRGETDSWSAF